ncbi:hypothetical protein PRK78_003173 [Emydomyces testavorans]|uniref:Uncharacterized protein n=1 Tax=Emydomyces testavorans TaxID=2070801 RepID=A0AAF0DFJ7_9EURO|nr:hypothetical protein PRK78_003173 [Emydomyces testavorans]
MGILWLFSLVFLGPLLVFGALLALSTFVQAVLGIQVMDFRGGDRTGVYDRNYLRTLTSSGAALSEQIELDDLTREAQTYDEDDQMR